LGLVRVLSFAAVVAGAVALAQRRAAHSTSEITPTRMQVKDRPIAGSL
jgi:hypothetical protein